MYRWIKLSVCAARPAPWLEYAGVMSCGHAPAGWRRYPQVEWCNLIPTQKCPVGSCREAAAAEWPLCLKRLRPNRKLHYGTPGDEKVLRCGNLEITKFYLFIYFIWKKSLKRPNQSEGKSSCLCKFLIMLPNQLIWMMPLTLNTIDFYTS